MVASSRYRLRKKRQITTSSHDFVPEFFKIFLPHITAHQLRIPRAFTKQFKETIQKKLVLKVHGEKSWNVELNETEDGVFITNGWQNFVKHHELSTGDFLVFRYAGNSSFIVKIFGTNGCKKDILAMEDIKTPIKIEDDEVEEKHSLHESTHKSGSSYRNQSHKRHNKLNEVHSTSIEKTEKSRLLRRSSRVVKATERTEQQIPYLIE